MRRAFGFSLLEMAIVLLIIAILATAVGIPLASQLDQQRTADTQKQLEAIKEAIYGFAMANGRLPCPATDGVTYGAASSNGSEALTGVACKVKLGYVPAVTLGISNIDSTGLALDAWGSSANRILYGVATQNISGPNCTGTQTSPLTTANGVRVATMDCIVNRTSPVSLISVCATTPTGSAGAATACAFGASLTTSAPFVLVSKGKNASTTGGADEQHNVDLAPSLPTLDASEDYVFVSRIRTDAGVPSGEFDDIVTWGSLNTLFARMVQGGKLP